MTFYSFRWLADRIGHYGWTLRNVSGRYWCYHGPSLPYIMVEVDERRVASQPIMVVKESSVDVLDECIKEIFGETIYDGSEEVIAEE